MPKALLALFLFAASSAFAQSRCDALFPAAGGDVAAGVPVTADLDTVIDQLARFQIEIDTLTREEDRANALEDWRAKSIALGLHQDVALKARYIARLNELRTGVTADKAVDKAVREDTLEAQRQAALGKWDQVAAVPELSEPGAVFGAGAGKMVSHKDGQVTVIDLATGTPDPQYAAFSQNAKRVAPGARFAATADGAYLAVIDNRHIEVWNAATGTIKSAVVGTDISQVRFSEDGKYLFSSSQIGLAYIHRTADMFELLKHSMAGARTNEKILTSPDGRYVYFNRDSHSTPPYDLHTGQFVNVAGDLWIYDIVDGFFTPDSRSFVFVGKRGEIFKMGLTGSTFQKLAETEGVKRLFGDATDSLLLTLEGPKQSRAYFIETKTQTRIDDDAFAGVEKIHQSVAVGDWVFFTASGWNKTDAPEIYAVNLRHRTVVHSDLSATFAHIEKLVPAADGSALYVRGRTSSGLGLYRIF